MSCQFSSIGKLSSNRLLKIVGWALPTEPQSVVVGSAHPTCGVHPARQFLFQRAANRRARPSAALCATLVLLTALSVVNAGFAQEGAPALTDGQVTAQDPATNEAQTNSQDSLEQTRKSSLISTTLFGTLIEGGWLMIPILIASVTALAFGTERLFVLRRRKVIPHAFTTRFLEHLEQDLLDQHLALELCEESGSPVASVFAHGVRKWGKPSVEIEQAIIDGGERQVGQLRKHLRILNGVATVAPLLGLLGTVVGMITAFNEIAGGTAMGKAEQLAGGIGVALLTTAGGLTVAIPSLILYMYLSGRVDGLIMEMDILSQRVVNLISAEAIAARRTAQQPRTRVRGSATVGQV